VSLFPLGLIAIGYAVAYWSLDILVQAYKRDTKMNPPPLSVCLGIPGAAAQPDTNSTPPGGPSPDVPGTTQPSTAGAPPIGFGQTGETDSQGYPIVN
jgi:hypothetical protein